MAPKLTHLETIVSLAPDGFGLLAGITDEAIRRSVSERRATRGGRHNPLVLHGLIREAILTDTSGSNQLQGLGIRVRGGQSDSLQVSVLGYPREISLSHRPVRTFAADLTLGDEGLFPRDEGRAHVFYGANGDGLRSFAIVETRTPKADLFFGCEVLDEIRIRPVVPAATVEPDVATTNEHDDLSDILESLANSSTGLGELQDDKNSGEAAVS